MNLRGEMTDEARRIGQIVAQVDNKEMGTACIGTTEWNRVRASYARLNELAAIFGEAIHQSFAQGYDETIDFLLNTEWRNEQEETTETIEGQRARVLLPGSRTIHPGRHRRRAIGCGL